MHSQRTIVPIRRWYGHKCPDCWRNAMSHKRSDRRPMKRRDFPAGIAVAAGAAVLAACGAPVQRGGQVQAPTAASGGQPAQATAAPPADNAGGTNPATLRWEFRGSQEDLDRA